MVLREILKTDTASSSHAKLNNYHTVVPTVLENTPDFSDKVGLLGDSQKYEAFKNIVFGDEALKRKHDEENDEKTKILKSDVTENCNTDLKEK